MNIIKKESNCKLTDVKHITKVNKEDIHFFPTSSIIEQEYIISSPQYSASLYQHLYQKGDDYKVKMMYFISSHTTKEIEGSYIITGFRSDLTPFEIEKQVKIIITKIIPSYKWMTKEQYKNILEKGFCKELTNYTSFSIVNLKGWIEAYRIKYMAAIRKQQEYEVMKKEQSYTPKNKKEKRVLKMRKFIRQLVSFKIVLQNPKLINESNEIDKGDFKKAFNRVLKIERYNQGYSLDMVFDYLAFEKKIKVSEEDLAKGNEFLGGEILAAAGLKPSEEIINKFAIVNAKTDYIIIFAKSLIENGEVEEFLEEFVNKYTTKK